MSTGRLGVLCSAVLAVSWNAVAGIEAPLSHASFEAAWNKGGESKPGNVVESYRLGTRHLSTGDIDVYLSTPYARAMYKSSSLKSKVRASEMEPQWEKVHESAGVYLLVTTIGTPDAGFIAPRKGEPQVQRASIRMAGTKDEVQVPTSSGRVKKGPERDYLQSLGMNWGWIFEFDPSLFSGDGSIEIIVDTTSHRAVIPVDRSSLLRLPENEKTTKP